MAKNIIIGQSGGPTAVINSSLAGVYKAARSLGADKVYGMKYGIEGLLKEELLELNVLLDDRMSIELLKRTPSSYLGSCRFKLPDPDTDATPFVKLFTLFDKYDICAVFYIGGNDSMDTIAKLSLAEKLCFIMLTLFLISLLPVCRLAFYAHPAGDDYAYGVAAHLAWTDTHSLSAVLAAAVSNVKGYYTSWQGTYSSIFLMSLQPAIFSQRLYFLTTFLTVGLFSLIDYSFSHNSSLSHNATAARATEPIIYLGFCLVMSIRIINKQHASFVHVKNRRHCY